MLIKVTLCLEHYQVQEDYVKKDRCIHCCSLHLFI